MKIFFDTEFTGLHKNTTLISIGLVDENGRQFYGEFTDYDLTQVDDWISNNVLKYVSDYSINPMENKIVKKGDSGAIRLALLYWLDKYSDTTIEFISDCSHYDFVLLIDLLWGNALNMPGNVCPICEDLVYLISKNLDNCSLRDAFNINREELIKDSDLVKTVKKHNALYDALVIKEIYQKLAK